MQVKNDEGYGGVNYKNKENLGCCTCQRREMGGNKLPVGVNEYVVKGLRALGKGAGLLNRVFHERSALIQI